MSAVLPLSALPRPVFDAGSGRADGGPKPLHDRVVSGRLSELSGRSSSGRMTAAVSLVIRAQADDEPVVWVQPEGGSLYPPDLAESGVDLDALVVVQVPARGGRRGGGDSRREGLGGRDRTGLAGDLARAAELLLRSGAFGLVVVDLGATAPRGSAWQGRLSALARQHETRVVLLSEGGDDAPSLGPMVGLRLAPTRQRRGPGRFVVEHRVLKDKLGGTAPRAERRRAPWGLG